MLAPARTSLYAGNWRVAMRGRTTKSLCYKASNPLFPSSVLTLGQGYMARPPGSVYTTPFLPAARLLVIRADAASFEPQAASKSVVTVVRETMASLKIARSSDALHRTYNAMALAGMGLTAVGAILSAVWNAWPFLAVFGGGFAFLSYAYAKRT